MQRQTGRRVSPDPSAPWQHLAADGEYVCLINGGLPRGVPAWEGLLDWMDEHEAAVRLRRRPPLVGEHNHEVYVGELGLTAAELRAYLESGVV